MLSFKGFRMNGAGAHIAGAPDRQDWFVAPCSRHRDSDALTEANWAEQLALLQEVDPDGNDHEVHLFGHWACGWFEIVLVRPGSVCEALCRDIETALCDYPVLNEERHSELQWEHAAQLWAGLPTAERRRLRVAAAAARIERARDVLNDARAEVERLKEALRRAEKAASVAQDELYGRVWEYLTQE